MTRGNQRDKAREKNLAKQAGEKTKKTGNPQLRKEADMKAMADKKAAKEAAAAAALANPDPKSKVGVGAKEAAQAAKK